MTARRANWPLCSRRTSRRMPVMPPRKSRRRARSYQSALCRPTLDEEVWIEKDMRWRANSAMIELRREPRVRVDIVVQVWGADADGEPFSQTATATDVSQSGALLVRMTCAPRSGDLIGIAYDGRKARFRVIWSLESGGCPGIRVAVQKLAADQCPWRDILSPLAACPLTRSNPDCE